MQNIRGMQDVHGLDTKKFEIIIKKAKEISMSYGFAELITPILEVASLFERNLGGESDVVKKEIYKFEDRGGETLALRPEFTAGVVRHFIQNNYTNGKFFSYGQLFRYDRPQKGRYRQFNQVNFESFGKDGFLEDAETVILANNFLNSLGLEGKFTLEISNLGSAETLERYKKELVDFFTKNKNELSELSRERLLKNPIRILDSKETEDIEICKLIPTISEFYTHSEMLEFQETLKILDAMNVEYQVNQRIVRGLDYYTGIVFEFTTTLLGSQSTILGGGRYNKLTENMGGKETPAIGFAAGIERLALLLELPDFQEKSLSILPLKEEQILESIKFAEIFRKEGIRTTILTNGNVGKRLEKASKEPFINFAIVLGEKELETRLFKMKNLNESKEFEGNLEFLISCLK